MSRRRSALAVAASTGLAGLTAGSALAQDDDGDELSAEHRRRRGRRGKPGNRGKRGKRGKQGPKGPKGPLAGSDVQLVTQQCNEDGEPDAVVACTAECPNGFIASGGGFEAPGILNAFGVVRTSRPALDGTTPVGWEVSIEWLELGQSFTWEAYAVCLPA